MGEEIYPVSSALDNSRALHIIQCVQPSRHDPVLFIHLPQCSALQYSSIPLRKQNILENADSEDFSGVLWEAAYLPYNNMLSSHMYSH